MTGPTEVVQRTATRALRGVRPLTSSFRAARRLQRIASPSVSGTMDRMSSLRCTAKLLKRLGIDDPGEPPNPTNALGDWFANIIYTRQGHFVILVSERSLLPVFTTARNLDELVPRFLTSLAQVLGAMGVPPAKIDREIEAMQPIYYGRTNSRSVLGTMNEYVQSFRYMLDLEPERTLFDWSLYFAGTPCGALGYQRPTTLTPRLLDNPHGFAVIEGGKP